MKHQLIKKLIMIVCILNQYFILVNQLPPSTSNAAHIIFSLYKYQFLAIINLFWSRKFMFRFACNCRVSSIIAIKFSTIGGDGKVTNKTIFMNLRFHYYLTSKQYLLNVSEEINNTPMERMALYLYFWELHVTIMSYRFSFKNIAIVNGYGNPTIHRQKLKTLPVLP